MAISPETTQELISNFLNLPWCIEHSLAPVSFDHEDRTLCILIADATLIPPIKSFLERKLINRVENLIFQESSLYTIQGLLSPVYSGISGDYQFDESPNKPILLNQGNKTQTLEGDAAPPTIFYSSPFGDNFEADLSKLAYEDTVEDSYITPFGLSMGDSLEKLEQYGIEDAGAFCKYLVRNVPKPHSEFERYVVIVTPVQGLSWVKGIGYNVNTNGYGYTLRSKYTELKEKLEMKYGKGDSVDYLSYGSIWDDPNDFMNGLLSGDRFLHTIWKREDQNSKLADNLTSLFLGATALSASQGYIALEYAFSNEKAAEDEISLMQDDAL